MFNEYNPEYDEDNIENQPSTEPTANAEYNPDQVDTQYLQDNQVQPQAPIETSRPQVYDLDEKVRERITKRMRAQRATIALRREQSFGDIESAEDKSRYEPTIEIKRQYSATRDELKKAAEKTTPSPIKNRLVLGLSGFSPRISTGRKGSGEILEDIRQMYPSWYGGASFHPFRKCLELEWPETLDSHLPVKKIGTRSFVFALDSANFWQRCMRAYDLLLEEATKNPEIENRYLRAEDFVQRIIRAGNDIAREFIVDPSRTYTSYAYATYALMFRDATMQFYNFEQAIAYKAKHPNRKVSALYSERSEQLPLDALAVYMSEGIDPFIDLSEIKNGIRGKRLISLPDRPTQVEFIEWRQVLSTMAKNCESIIVRGDPNEFRGSKRELARTLNGQNTPLAEKLEYIASRTSFKGDFVLEIDPLFTQYMGGKALRWDRNLTYQFYTYMRDLLETYK